MSVKVAGADGVTSLVRVLMALDWVRRNRNSNGLHIRVLNLSFGVDQRRSYVREPLAYAAEQLWNRGVAVVAAAGNRADGTGSLDLPGRRPVPDRGRRDRHPLHRRRGRRQRRRVLLARRACARRTSSPPAPA